MYHFTLEEKRFPAEPRLHGPCDAHLAHVSNMVSGERKDVYTPLCDNEGYYAPLQCNNDTTSCWCVDRYGSMIEGTRMKGKLPVCGKSYIQSFCIVVFRRASSKFRLFIHLVLWCLTKTTLR